MKCDICHADLPANAVQCPGCGAAVPDSPDWAALVTAGAAGDQQALTQLYQLTAPELLKSLRPILHEDADVQDVLQDAYLKAFSSLNRLETPSVFPAWLRRIATNTALDQLRKKQPVPFTSCSFDQEDGSSTIPEPEEQRSYQLPEDSLDRKETARLLEQLLSVLNDEQRRTVILFYYQGLSLKEISGLLGCSVNTIKTRLFHGRKRLQRELEQLALQGIQLYGLAPIPFLTALLRHAEQFTVSAAEQAAIDTVEGQAISGAAAAQPAMHSVHAVPHGIRAAGSAAKAAVLGISRKQLLASAAALMTVACIGIGAGAGIHHLQQNSAPVPPGISRWNENLQAAPEQAAPDTAGVPKPVVPADTAEAQHGSHTGSPSTALQPQETDAGFPLVMYVCNTEYAAGLWTDSDRSSTICLVPVGEAVTALAQMDNPDYLRVSYQGQTGCMERACLSSTPPETDPVVSEKYIAVSAAQLLTAPYNGAAVLNTLPLGTAVGFIRTVQDAPDYALIRYDGTAAYVLASCLSDTLPNTLSAAEPEPEPTDTQLAPSDAMASDDSGYSPGDDSASGSVELNGEQVPDAEPTPSPRSEEENEQTPDPSVNPEAPSPSEAPEETATPDGSEDPDTQYALMDPVYADDIVTIASGNCDDGLSWHLDSLGMLYVTGEGIISSGDPWQNYREQIRVVILAEGLLAVNDGAFSNCRYLQMVQLPATLRLLGKSAFSGCSALQYVELNEGLLTIAEDAFSSCPALTELYLPSTVQQIESSAFEGTAAGLTVHCAPDSPAAVWAAENGIATLLCSSCDLHSYASATTSCSFACIGWVPRRCSECGHLQIKHDSAPVGHRWGGWLTRVNETTGEQEQYRICRLCNGVQLADSAAEGFD